MLISYSCVSAPASYMVLYVVNEDFLICYRFLGEVGKFFHAITREKYRDTLPPTFFENAKEGDDGKSKHKVILLKLYCHRWETTSM